VIITKKIITDSWNYILDQSYNYTKTTKKPRSIIYYQKDCTFFLKIPSGSKLKAIEEWHTPFGTQTITVTKSREVLACLDKWYQVLKEDDTLFVLEMMKKNNLIKLESSDQICSDCKKETSEPKRKPRAKKKIIVKKTKKVLKGEKLGTVDDEKSIDLKEVTLKQLRGATLEERINVVKEKKISWKDFLLMYFEENVTNTKVRHPEHIAREMEIDLSFLRNVLKEMEEADDIQKEFTGLDYYILTKNFKSETARKHLEILDFLKQHLDCPGSKCTQVSVALNFDLPYAMVGFVLNDLAKNKLITKEKTQVTINGVTRSVACYIPSSF
jgi:hypothetical protein